jgi:hypothetical protein
MVLVIWPEQLALVIAPALADEIRRELRVLLLAGRVGELEERELDLLMPADIVPLVRAELGVDEVRVLDADVEQRALARRIEVSHARFDQVTGAVKLVVVLHVAETLIELIAELIEGVEIAVRPLGLGHHGDEVI